MLSEGSSPPTRGCRCGGASSRRHARCPPADLARSPPAQVEICFWAGLERYFHEGFRLGNPKAYLHPPGHPHQANPDFHGCEGCCPPVHGKVLCLANIKGTVQMLCDAPDGGLQDSGLGGGGGRSSLEASQLGGDGWQGDEGGAPSPQGTWVRVTLQEVAPSEPEPGARPPLSASLP